MTEVVFGERVLLLLLLGLGRLNLLALPCFWMTPVDWAGGSAPFRGDLFGVHSTPFDKVCEGSIFKL